MRALLRPVPLLVALALFYFGSLLIAATVYPKGYDWRHTVISNLASPTQNPAAYPIASGGLAASGLILSLLGLCVGRVLRPYAPAWTPRAQFFFVLGGILLTISALITPGHHALLGLPKAHAKLAQAAGIAFGLALVLNLPAILRLPARLSWVRITAVVLIALPMTLYFLSRLAVPMLEDQAPAAPRDTIAHSIIASLGFWEWIGSISVYLFLALITLAIKPAPDSTGR